MNKLHRLLESLFCKIENLNFKEGKTVGDYDEVDKKKKEISGNSG